MATPRRYERVLLPQDRPFPCRDCRDLRKAGKPMRAYCQGCLLRDIGLYPADHQLFKDFQAAVDDRAYRARHSLKLSGRQRTDPDGGRRGPGSGGLSRLNPDQRRLYDYWLALALHRAKLKGKRTDGAHGQPYRMGVLSRVLWAGKPGHGGGIESVRAARRLACIRQRLARFHRAKLRQRLGLPTVGPAPPRKPDGDTRTFGVDRPRSVYSGLAGI